MTSRGRARTGPPSDAKRIRNPCIRRFCHSDRLPKETRRDLVVAICERGVWPPGRMMGRSGMTIPSLKSLWQTKVCPPTPRIYRLTFHADHRCLSRIWIRVWRSPRRSVRATLWNRDPTRNAQKNKVPHEKGKLRMLPMKSRKHVDLARPRVWRITDFLPRMRTACSWP